MAFAEDLKEGLEIEQHIASALEFWGKTAFSDTSEYDLSLTIQIEVKFDRMARQTGNVAIEVGSKHKRTGLSITEAMWWVYVLDGIPKEYYLCKVSDLKDYIRDNWKSLNRISGGDGNRSKMVLLKIEDFKKLFKKLNHEDI